MRDLVLSKIKIGVMVQDNFMMDEPINFLCRVETTPPTEQIFATAIARQGAILKIDATKASMWRQVELFGKWQWLPLSKEKIQKVIWNEGFAHVDDFWSNIDKRKNRVLIVTQIYFDNVSPVNHEANHHQPNAQA